MDPAFPDLVAEAADEEADNAQRTAKHRAPPQPIAEDILRRLARLW